VSAVRRLARTVYADSLVCTCGAVLSFDIKAPVGVELADVYTMAVGCKTCGAVWGVQLHRRDYPHLRIQRLDRSGG
jgi:hypothetical protein